MTYAFGVEVLQWAFRIAVFGLIGTVVYKMLVGTIPLTDLLSGSEGGDLQLERLQAVALAIAIPSIYLLDCMTALKGADIPRSLPDAQNWMLAAGLGSQALYLGGKIIRS